MRSGDAGVTLIEVLVALSIVAVMAAAGTLALRTGPGDTAETEARKLAARLSFAVDETLSTGLPLRLSHAPGGYRFAREEGGEWRDVERVPLAPHTLPGGIVLANDGEHTIGADGFGAPFALTLRGAAAAWRVRFDGLNAVAEGV